MDDAKERLRAVAILDGEEILDRDVRSHYELRADLNPDNCDHSQSLPGQVDGFITTAERFVDREEAKAVAIAAGQIHESWKTSRRPLLSSDVAW